MSCVAEVEKMARLSALAAAVQEVGFVEKTAAMASDESAAAAGGGRTRCWTERAVVQDHLYPDFP